jgi:hypothetical protein
MVAVVVFVVVFVVVVVFVAFIALEMDFIKNGDASFFISYFEAEDRRITVFPMRIGSNDMTDVSK